MWVSFAYLEPRAFKAPSNGWFWSRCTAESIGVSASVYGGQLSMPVRLPWAPQAFRGYVVSYTAVGQHQPRGLRTQTKTGIRSQKIAIPNTQAQIAVWNANFLLEPGGCIPNARISALTVKSPFRTRATLRGHFGYLYPRYEQSSSLSSGT